MFTRARWSLTAWYAGLMTATIATLGAAAYVLIRQDIDAEIDESLDGATEQVLASRPPSDPGTFPDAGGDDDEHDHDENDEHPDDLRAAALPSDVFFVLYRANGELVANPRRVNLEGIDLAELQPADGGESYREVTGDDSHYRLAVVEWPAEDGVLLAVGRSLRQRDHQLGSIATLFVVGGLAALGLSAGSGFLLAGRALAPIRRSFETQRRFVSDASHELRTPLSIARVHADLLTEDTSATVESRIEHVEAIASEVDRMTALVSDLLTLARADEGRANLLMQDLDVDVVVSEVGRDMAALAELRGVGLRVETQPGKARADRDRLRQLVVILVDNALKYTPEGGHVTLRCQPEGRHVEIAVTDTGPGIAPEDQRHIFERFYRADSARSRGTGGTGLGLSIAAWIAEVHGGHISVQSERGQGSTFRVRLPRA